MTSIISGGSVCLHLQWEIKSPGQMFAKLKEKATELKDPLTGYST